MIIFSSRLAPKGYGVGLGEEEGGGDGGMEFLLEIIIRVTLCRLKRKEWLSKLGSDIIMMLSIPGGGGRHYYSY